jgi:hypothetical protein
MKLTRICNPDTNVSIASIAAHKVQEICNPPPFIQLLCLMKRKCTHMPHTCVFSSNLLNMPSFLHKTHRFSKMKKPQLVPYVHASSSSSTHITFLPNENAGLRTYV